MSIEGIELRHITSLSDEILPLVIEAEGQGHQSMRRLQDGWIAGMNRFQGPGEFLLGLYGDERLMAVGGLNTAPYSASSGISRLRHVYVIASARRTGIGTRLVASIMEAAAQSFSIMRLRTKTAEAAAFYETLGFLPTTEGAATHTIRFHAT